MHLLQCNAAERSEGDGGCKRSCKEGWLSWDVCGDDPKWGGGGGGGGFARRLLGSPDASGHCAAGVELRHDVPVTKSGTCATELHPSPPKTQDTPNYGDDVEVCRGSDYPALYGIATMLSVGLTWPRRAGLDVPATKQSSSCAPQPGPSTTSDAISWGSAK